MEPLRLEIEPRTHPEPEAVQSDVAFLNHLRFVSLGCRAKARADLFQACALLHADRSASRYAHAEALMRTLGQALGHEPMMYSPSTTEMSFDERWLLALAKAMTSGDDDSVRFLLNSRISPENRRLVRFLMGRISECFSQL